LFSKYAILPGRDRRVVEPGGIDRDFIPTMNRIETLSGSARRDDGASVKAPSEGPTEAVISPGREGYKRNAGS